MGAVSYPSGSTDSFDMSNSSGSFKFPTGAATGMVDNVISGSGATATLTAAQSGSTVLFDRAAGIVFTLPAPAVGLCFLFVVTVSVTSNAHEVDTDAGTTFITGGVAAIPNSATSANSFIANGTSHIKISSNGTTTGGLKGSSFTMTCISSTVWAINGMVMGSGTLATPFA